MASSTSPCKTRNNLNHQAHLTAPIYPKTENLQSKPNSHLQLTKFPSSFSHSPRPHKTPTASLFSAPPNRKPTARRRSDRETHSCNQAHDALITSRHLCHKFTPPPLNDPSHA
ncbi:hypothetical protein M0R45_036050 [Rubus argutus]|uniref:Uncharacterized protein n=1 Tax=Rubus argutus TaxID=59490 RepID=A0AAW1VUW8_RUBAR